MFLKYLLIKVAKRTKQKNQPLGCFIDYLESTYFPASSELFDTLIVLFECRSLNNATHNRR